MVRDLGLFLDVVVFEFDTVEEFGFGDVAVAVRRATGFGDDGAHLGEGFGGGETTEEGDASHGFGEADAEYFIG